MNVNFFVESARYRSSESLFERLKKMGLKAAMLSSFFATLSVAAEDLGQSPVQTTAAQTAQRVHSTMNQTPRISFEAPVSMRTSVSPLVSVNDVETQVSTGESAQEDDVDGQPKLIHEEMERIERPLQDFLPEIREAILSHASISGLVREVECECGPAVLPEMVDQMLLMLKDAEPDYNDLNFDYRVWDAYVSRFARSLPSSYITTPQFATRLEALVDLEDGVGVCTELKRVIVNGHEQVFNNALGKLIKVMRGSLPEEHWENNLRSAYNELEFLRNFHYENIGTFDTRLQNVVDAHRRS